MRHGRSCFCESVGIVQLDGNLRDKIELEQVDVEAWSCRLVAWACDVMDYSMP